MICPLCFIPSVNSFRVCCQLYNLLGGHDKGFYHVNLVVLLCAIIVLYMCHFGSMGLDLSKGTVRNNLEAGVIEPAMSKVKIIQVSSSKTGKLVFCYSF